jgi:phosphatidylglycerophosphate synthase/choline kinase
MLRIPPVARLPLRILSAFMGSALFGYLIWKAGPHKLWDNAAKLGWGFVWVLAAAGISHVFKAWAWRLTLDHHKHKISFPRLMGLRLGAEAAGQLGVVGQTFGDSVRVARLGPDIPKASGLASVTLDRALYLVTGIIILIAGLVGALPALSHSHTLRLYAGLSAVSLGTFLLFTLLAVRKRWQVISKSARILGRVPFLHKWIETEYVLIQSVENALLDFHHNSAGPFWGSFFLTLASHCLSVMEVCLVFHLMGVNFGLFSALGIEAMTKLVNLAGSVNPGNFGTFEGGNMLIAKMFGLAAPLGLTLALARRMRALFWTAVGGVCLFILTKSSSRGNAEGRSTASNAPEENIGTEAVHPSGVTLGRNFAVAILVTERTADNAEIGAGLARVGSLPILLRNILAARKLGASRILVVIDAMLRRRVHFELSSVGRLPESVRWIEAYADLTFSGQLRTVAAHACDERVIILDGKTSYHFSLLQKAMESNAEGIDVVLDSHGEDIGIYALSAATCSGIAKRSEAQVATLQQFLIHVDGHPLVDRLSVPGDLWQRVDTEQDLRSAERKLDRWLVKTTDGIYARLNRRISIPISRQLIKFPVTANMVTLFTLTVGMASAIYFSLGGYWNTLVGAFLCLSASILDGSDGEVARLKLQESSFGCWLETVCDYLFYLFLFAGMTVGLWRSTGSRTYLIWGAMLLFGAIVSFLAIGWERHRLTADRPEQLLKIWQAHAESRPSNPFLYVARNIEFIVRRCFFPYALLVFALFNIMNVAFVISAMGANLVWPIALYSSHAFASRRNSVPRIPRASATPRTSIRQYAPIQP